MLKCRMCGGDGRVMLSLIHTPIANSFPETPDLDAQRYPLDLMQCFTCDHVQLAEHVSVDWGEYRYATPEANRPHLAAAAAVLRGTYPEAKTVLEIGSNNGLYLEELTKQGFEAYGVDPCTKMGIAAPFTHKLAWSLEPVDLIVANNVLAHVDDLDDVFRGIDLLLKDDGALVFEVQNFHAMMFDGCFDMIYHEHRDYHTYAPWPRFLKRYGLVVREYRQIPTHGGSMRLFCERPGVEWLMPVEPLDWKWFKHQIRKAKRSIQSQILEVDGPIAAFGASAKACTLLHNFSLTGLIDYCIDNTPAKQGRYIPGTNIQILPESYLANHTPAAVLLTAWNFEAQIRAKYPHLNFIVPFCKEVPICPPR